jgi:hypothetical protein
VTTADNPPRTRSLWVETEPKRYRWSGEPDHRGVQLDCDVFLLDGRIVANATVRGTWVVGGDGELDRLRSLPRASLR